MNKNKTNFIPYHEFYTETPWTICIDPGHGGMIINNYQTFPNKMYQHPDFIFYEGVFNRQIAMRLGAMLKEEGISHFFSTDSNYDISLPLRTIMSNNYGRVHPDKKQLFLSLHGNAAPTGAESATGIEVFTSKGDTPADPMAEIFFEELKEMGWKMRKDTLDGDSDKEENFYVLKYTKCPAVLVELGFYTNLEQAKEMMTEITQVKLTTCLLNAIKRIIKE